MSDASVCSSPIVASLKTAGAHLVLDHVLKVHLTEEAFQIDEEM